MSKVTISDVSKEAGVSKTLVSFVMSNLHQKYGQQKYNVNKETAERVIKVAKKLGYKPNKAASSLRSGKQYTIGVITSDIANHFFSDIARYIENIAYENGYSVLFASSDESEEKMQTIVDIFLNSSVDGIIAAPCNGSKSSVQSIMEAGIPVVLFDRDIPELHCSKVMLDNVYAGRMAVDHLFDQGYRKIDFINYTLGISSMDDRELGYRQAMEEHSLGANINVMRTVYGNAEKDVEKFLDASIEHGSDAIIFPTNTLSVIGLRYLNEKKIKVPSQLAVLCFDNMEGYDLFSPKITRITQPMMDIAQESFKILLAQMEQKTQACRKLILMPELIVYQSTTPKITNQSK